MFRHRLYETYTPCHINGCCVHVGAGIANAISFINIIETHTWVYPAFVSECALRRVFWRVCALEYAIVWLEEREVNIRRKRLQLYVAQTVAVLLLYTPVCELYFPRNHFQNYVSIPANAKSNEWEDCKMGIRLNLDKCWYAFLICNHLHTTFSYLQSLYLMEYNTYWL